MGALPGSAKVWGVYKPASKWGCHFGTDLSLIKATFAIDLVNE
jgi:hypothetical protein